MRVRVRDEGDRTTGCKRMEGAGAGRYMCWWGLALRAGTKTMQTRANTAARPDKLKQQHHDQAK